MSYSWSIFLLVTVVASAKRNMFLDVFERLTGARNSNCANDYTHDPDLFSELHGYRYILYTSASANNKIIEYDPTGNGSIFARSTKDGECCTTFYITSGKEYNSFDVANDADCSTKLSESDGQMKLIASNAGDDGSSCIVTWTCRKSRKGVHALCDEPTVSKEQSEWICKQFEQMSLTPLKVDQTTDYKGGKCFKN